MPGLQHKIEIIREVYGKLESFDPTSFGARCLGDWMDLKTTEQLKRVSAANIKWVSAVAAAKVRERKLA